MGKSALNKHSKFKKKSCPRERGVQPPQHPPPLDPPMLWAAPCNVKEQFIHACTCNWNAHALYRKSNVFILFKTTTPELRWINPWATLYVRHWFIRGRGPNYLQARGAICNWSGSEFRKKKIRINFCLFLSINKSQIAGM